eukprot:gene13147-17615_t
MKDELNRSTDDCENTAKLVIQNSKLLQNILSNMNDQIAINCRPCLSSGNESNARGFLSINALENEQTTKATITICSNRAKKKEIEEILHHEVIHAYDYTNKRCDFSTCNGLAYSEVRAAREAECKGSYPFEFLRDQCVKSYAIRSTANLFPNTASQCVAEVFEEAIKDMEPLPSFAKSNFKEKF